MDLLIAHRVWLMGQDEQLLRPRTPALRVAATTAGLLDLIRSGTAAWNDSGTQVQTSTSPAGEPALVRSWEERFEDAAAGDPLDTVYAIDALAPGVWEEVAADAAQRGVATAVPRRIRRWLPPRYRPDADLTREMKVHLRDLVHSSDEITDPVDEAVLAIGWSAGVLDELLSLTALTDPDIVDSARTRLEDNELVARIEDAVEFLSSARPPAATGSGTPGSPAS